MTKVTIVYEGREGRRVNGRYEIRFLAQTSDGKEFWAYKNAANARKLAEDYISSLKGE